MTITWLGHACFCVESKGCRVILDPYTMEDYPPMHARAGAVLCSHEHRDHNFREAVELVSEPDHPFSVRPIPSFHDDAQGALRGENTIHVLTAEGLRVAHLGDLGHALTPEQLEALRGCDVLLIPVGGFYTIDAPTAVEVAKAVGARVVVPMHYRHGAYGLRQVGGVEEFLKAWDEACVHRLAGNSFAVSGSEPAGVIVPAFCPPEER